MDLDPATRAVDWLEIYRTPLYLMGENWENWENPWFPWDFPFNPGIRKSWVFNMILAIIGSRSPLQDGFNNVENPMFDGFIPLSISSENKIRLKPSMLGFEMGGSLVPGHPVVGLTWCSSNVDQNYKVTCWSPSQQKSKKKTQGHKMLSPSYFSRSIAHLTTNYSYVYIYILIHVALSYPSNHTSISIYLSIYLSIYVCMYIYIYIYVYTDKYPSKHSYNSHIPSPSHWQHADATQWRQSGGHHRTALHLSSPRANPNFGAKEYHTGVS